MHARFQAIGVAETLRPQLLVSPGMKSWMPTGAC